MTLHISQVPNLEKRLYTNFMQRGRKPKKEAPLFGQRLASLRNKRGMTQYELAEQLGVSRHMIVHYERTCENPTMDFVVRVAQILDASTDELFGIKPIKERRGPSPRVKQLTEKLTMLPKLKQNVILDMLESYFSKG